MISDAEREMEIYRAFRNQLVRQILGAATGGVDASAVLPTHMLGAGGVECTWYDIIDSYGARIRVASEIRSAISGL